MFKSASVNRFSNMHNQVKEYMGQSVSSQPIFRKFQKLNLLKFYLSLLNVDTLLICLHIQHISDM